MFKKILLQLRIFGQKLSKIPIVYLLILYVSLIFVFGFLYSCPFASFYHSTISYEKQVDQSANELSSILRKRILDNLSNYIEGDFLKFDSWVMNTNDFQFHIVGEDEKSIFANIYVLFYHQQDNELVISFKGISQYGGNFKIKIGLYENRLKIGDAILLPINFDNSKLGYEDISLDVKFLFSDVMYNSALKIDSKLMSEIIKYHKTTQGFPSGLQDNIIRMLYFSAVTITTLGYGDIVPLNNFSRILAAIEATLGVLILGLCLNSLTSLKSDKVN